MLYTDPNTIMLKRFSLSGFIFAVSLLTMIAQPADYQSLINAGYEKLQINDYYGAIDVFTKAIQLNDGASEAFLGRAKAYLELENYEKALNDAGQATDMTPDEAAGYVLLSKIHSGLGNFELALDDVDLALQAEPKNPDAINQQALVLLYADETKEASKILDEQIKNNPDYGGFYYSRGILNNSRERYDRAVEDFNKAEELNTGVDAFEIYINRAFAQVSLSNYEAALNDFTNATLLKPTNASAFHGKGRANYLLENYHEAVVDFETAMELNENNPVIYYDLAMAYLRLDNMNNACKNFQRSCQLGNTNGCKKLILECASELEF